MPGYDNELAAIVDELNRTATGTRPPAITEAPPPNAGSLDQVLRYAVAQNASDLLVIAGAPVALRIDGKLTAGTGAVLSSEDTRKLLLPLLNTKQSQDLQRDKSIDFCFLRESIGRFRANLHHQRGSLAGSI